MSSSFKLHKAASLSAIVVSAALLISVSAQADEAAQTDQSILGTKTEVVAGFSANYIQRYMGSADMHLQVLPTIVIRRGIFFADITRGLGAEYQSPSGFYVGQMFNYDMGRTDQNSYLRPGSNQLKGMGDVKGTVTSTTAVAQQIVHWLSINAQAELGLDGHVRGNQYQIGLESIASPTAADTITVDLDAKIADSRYNQTYFGVTPTQSAATGFRSYSPNAGIYAYMLNATWDHKLDAHWTSELVLGGTLYTSAAANSPIMDHRFAPTIYTALSYAF